MVHEIVEYFGINSGGHKCGYCKGIKPDSADYGMWTHALSTESYEYLMDRNWRRCGKYCYKPVLNKSCCPQYTIRCDPLEFKLSRSQRRVIKRFNNYLLTGERPKRIDKPKNNQAEVDKIQNDLNPKKIPKLINEAKIEKDIPRKMETKCLGFKKEEKFNIDQYDLLENRKKSKTKTKRIYRRIEIVMKVKNLSREQAIKLIVDKHREKVKSKLKTLEDHLNPLQSKNMAHNLQIKFVSTCNKEYESTFDETHKLYQKYQIAIHKDEPDECTKKQYKRFLITNPFEVEEFNSNLGECANVPISYGSYHMQYWLDEKLIAVGVIDILKHSISSVYLFYDPDYYFLSLGTYSSLREIALSRELNRITNEIRYYYMGFYIHSCQKMRYKGLYTPSYLLSPEVFNWVPIEKCIPKLDKSKYNRLNDNLNEVDMDGKDIQDSHIMVLYQRKIMSLETYKIISRISQREENNVKEFASLVGKKCINNLILYMS